MKWELSLHPADVSQRPASAWFVPGDSAEIWLDALAELPIEQSQARLLIVPHSLTDRTPLGALIVPAPDGAKRGNSEPPPHAQRMARRRRTFVCPYGTASGRLYAPVEAMIRPPATDAELKELLADDQSYVWHPSAGLVPFSAADFLRPADLLAAPSEVKSEWSRAAPGVAYNCRLLSLSLTVTPSLEQMIERVRGEIGSRSNELASLPPSPRESRPSVFSRVRRLCTAAFARFALWLSNLGSQGGRPSVRRRINVGRAVRLVVGSLAAGLLIAFVIYAVYSLLHGATPISFDELLGAILVIAMVAWLLRGLFEGVSFFTRRAEARSAARSRRDNAGRSTPASPGGARSAGWLGRLGAWARSKLQQVNESIQSARNRELDRLVEVLENDPDAGLRFAIPLAGDIPRGAGQPGTRLTNRTVDFSGGRTSTGLADYWDVQGEYRRKLTQQYRTLANREISLGRHRRAAYILAELLGDWNAAANSLADGGHYREAAIIYRERMKRPDQAADCLERGGLLTEAIVIHEQLEHYEKVGDLYAKLEQPDEAERAYRRAVDAKRATSDRLGAANLLESKLDSPQEAWIELSEGWPTSPQAENCLRASFAWTQRYGDADRAARFLRDASTRARTSRETVQFVGCISSIATEYPDPSVRVAASESVLTIASTRLPRAEAAELTGLTTALRRLAPEDRLLSRDCERYSRDRSAATPAVQFSNTNDTQPQPLLQLRKEIKLPFDNVRACVASAEAFYAAGWREQELVIIRGNWQGTVQYPAGAPWKFPSATPESAILMAVEAVGEEIVFVHPVGIAPAAYLRTFPITDQLPRSVYAGGFAGLTSNTIGLSAVGKVHVIDIGNSAFMMRAYHGSSLSLAETTWCNHPDMEGTNIPLPYQHREGVHYLSIGCDVFFVRGNELQPLHECDDHVVRLVASPAHSRPRLIAVLPQGAQIIWGVVRGSPATTFARDMAHPQVLIHRDGWIIAADRRGCEVFVVKRESLQLHVATQWEDHGEVVALLNTPFPNVFAACFASGHILQFQIPNAR